MDAERMYQRQQQRVDLAEHWLDLLALQEGAVLLDVGAGPGLFSLMAARRVGAGGLIYAVDISPESLRFLCDRAREAGLTNIECVEANARTMAPLPRLADAALITFMLHHDPQGDELIANVAGMLRKGARAVVAEFDPAGPCENGPARERRLEEPTVRGWCERAGLQVVQVEQQTPEQYLIVIEKQ